MRGRLGTPAGYRALSAAQRQYDNETPEEDGEDDPEEDVEEEEKETASAKAARIELAALDNKLAEREEECKGLRAEVDKIEGWAFAAVARAEKAEAEVERLRALCAEAGDVLGLCDEGRAGNIFAPEDHMVREACDRIGYGAIMDSAQRQWEMKDPIGCFTIGPCLGTVRPMVKRLLAAGRGEG